MQSNNSTLLLTPQEQAQCAAKMGEIVKQARWIPFQIVLIGLLGFIQAAVGYIEWELLLQVFKFLAGGEEGYWSANVMACSGLLVIVGFHVLARQNPQHRAVVWISRIAGVLIPVYAVGVGLLLASILFSDGPSGMFADPTSFSFFEAEAATESVRGNWLEWAFENLTNPLAVLIFSLAVGGLAILNLFLSHHLITAITHSMTSVYHRFTCALDARQNYAAVREAQKRFLELAHERREIALLDDEALAAEIAIEALAAIQEALSPHKCLLKDLEYAAEPSRLVVPEHIPPKPKQLARDIDKIDAISVTDIFEALGVSTPFEGNR